MTRLLGWLFSSFAIGLVFAVLGVAGLVYYYGRDLPGPKQLEDYQPKLLSRVYSSDGTKIAEYATEDRIFMPISEVPDLVKEAFISAEDKHFYEHPGIDMVGILKALARYAVSRAEGHDERLSGASTITQQVMKNFLLDSDRSLERKIKEAILSVRFDGTLSKDQILELYLNEIYLGAGSYGIAAAAQNYFGKRLDQLTPEEAAYLAALPKAPSDLNPVRNHDRAVARRNYVLDQMADNGYLTRAQAEAAKAKPLVTVLDSAADTGDMPKGPELGYFTSQVRRQVTDELGHDALYQGGLTVRATVDPHLQEIAGQALRRELVKYDRDHGVWRGPLAHVDLPQKRDDATLSAALAGVNAPRDIPGWHLAVVLSADASAAQIYVEDKGRAKIERNGETWIRSTDIDGQKGRAPAHADDLWHAGDVIFVVQNPDNLSDWDMRQIPELEGAFMAMDPETGRVLALWGGFSYQDLVFNRATQAKRQPGSSFKPFVYAAALDAGYTPATIVEDEPVAIRQPDGSVWTPKNSSGETGGPMPMRRGLELSRNLMTVRIAQDIGMDRVAAYAERFGVYHDMPHILSYALGAGEVTLYDMVAAYGMFDNGGKRVRPTVVDRIEDRNGKTIYRHDPRECEACADPAADPAALPKLYDARAQIMNPGTAFQIVSMLQGVVQRGTAAQTVGGTGLPLAGKTGTTNDSKDAWFIGFSPHLVAGCFIGFDQPRSMGRHAYGGTLCGPVFHDFMVEALKGADPGQFTPPPDLVAAKVNRITGERLADDASGSNVITEYFQQGHVPDRYAQANALASDVQLFGQSYAGKGPPCPTALTTAAAPAAPHRAAASRWTGRAASASAPAAFTRARPADAAPGPQTLKMAPPVAGKSARRKPCSRQASVRLAFTPGAGIAICPRSLSRPGRA